MSERFSWISGSLAQTVLSFLIVALSACGAPDTSEKVTLPKKQARKVAVIAHRGASGLAPENTLAAIRKALDTEADFIEVDVHQSKDGQVVVIHDATVDRTTNGTGAVANLTLAQLKELDAGSKHDSSFTGERIPTLAQVLKLVKGKKKLLIELKKGEDDYYQGLEDNTLRLIREHRADDWTVLQSFHDPILERIWAADFVIPTHKLIVGKIPFLPVYIDHELKFGGFDRYSKAASINVHRYFASKSFIRSLHNQGFKTFIWTEDKPQNIRELYDMGADGVMTNHPELVERR
ncbi:glycerophosphodiester phosphodiesterase [Rufibacter quisquiliarum]|uniref:Glycerophosphoryl diester phosphodiesterase n=1 Tax=Rufibacter quisquiliarum TaxID=1549639 RepID=A0A839GT18_9BACT|nr:glycerophosphodiester phosphodiesterase family protein [Rufibacter quisquiliarum]MBA9077558.1 glycerophosphoryl diester phosphodiesterase [Rufibacter quisquiliarum]